MEASNGERDRIVPLRKGKSEDLWATWTLFSTKGTATVQGSKKQASSRMNINDVLASHAPQWRIAPGDATYVFIPGVAKPINCGSQKAAALIVAAVNAYQTPDCRACKGSGWIQTGTPGERVPCDCGAHAHNSGAISVNTCSGWEWDRQPAESHG
jgi:hypothetical protein